MKKLSLFDKFIFVVNSLIAAICLLSYLLPYLPPKSFKVIATLSLSVPVFLLLNIVFCLYWILRFKKQFLLSLVVLLVGFNLLKSMFEFGHEPIVSKNPSDISLLSYNARFFNSNNWSPNKFIRDSIYNFVEKENPDILFFQEFYKPEYKEYKKLYPHAFQAFNMGYNRNGQAIFSKYEIVNKGSFDFENSFNNIIYADLKIKDEIIRVYNFHLETTGVNSKVELEKGVSEADSEVAEEVARTIANSFVKQQHQVDAFIAHAKKFKGKFIIAGDFNNTAYSYIYNKIRREFDVKDSFEEMGSGFGTTYNFKYFPMRIDFVLPSHKFTVKSHQNFKKALSDHYPVKVVLGL